MKPTQVGLALAGALLALPAFGQTWDPIQARITGSTSGGGKCTIDVEIDDVVEIEVSGATARMRTLSGSRATWRRLQCNMPMPGNPGEFKFSPQEGRGRQTLLREPAINRGVALVRLEDPSGGREGYKFDLEWRGDNGGPLTSGGLGNNNGGSIFGNGGNNGGFGNNNGGFGNGPANADVNVTSRGEGYYRNFRGSDDNLTDSQVIVERNGNVQVQFNTSQRGRISLNGRVILNDGNRIVADMSGGEIRGTMEILLNGRNRVDEVALTGVGRNRAELRWTRR